MSLGRTTQANLAWARQLLLRETLADAHYSMGVVLNYLDWDFSGAEWEFGRSLELDPDYWGGYLGLGILNRNRSRFDSAIAALKRARDLEPYGIMAVGLNSGVAYYCAGRFDNAIEQFLKMLELNPVHGALHVLLADAYACTGQREKAINECEQGLAAGHGVAIARLSAACTYARIGKTEEVRKILQEAESAWEAGDPSFFIAAVHARLGERDAAWSREQLSVSAASC